VSWIRGSSTGHVTLSNDIVAAITNTSVLTVAIDGTDASTGYVAGDILTIAGGTSVIAAQVEVVTVDGGGTLTAVRMYNGGSYTVAPSTPNSATGGTGSGAVLAITTGTKGWTLNGDQVWDGGTEREVFLEGNGGGSDNIYVGWRTYSNAGAQRWNWELHGFTGYSETGGTPLPTQNQPGISPGDHTGISQDERGAYLLLTNGSMNWFLSVTSFRIILIVEAGSGKWYPMYLGFLNRFATATEYPYPVMVCGPTDYYLGTANQSERMSTLVNPWTTLGSTNGPMQIIDPAGTWDFVSNNTVTGTGLNPAGIDNFVTPCGYPQASSASGGAPEIDRHSPFSTQLNWSRIIDAAAADAADANLLPTPGTGADAYALFPAVVQRIDTDGGNPFVFGEISDCFWMSGQGTITAQDRIIQGSDLYRVFFNCNGTQLYDYFAVKEV